MKVNSTKSGGSIGVGEEIKSHRRLGGSGRNDYNARCLILVTLASKLVRDRILNMSCQLKNVGR